MVSDLIMGDGRIAGVHHVVAGLLVEGDKVLLCHRSADRTWYPDVWDFPGGHVEDGETASAALVRELFEELGIVISEPDEPAFAHLLGSDVDCQLWVVRRWSGTPQIVAQSEHDDVSWWSHDAIGDVLLADEAYRSLIERAL